jgi:transcriptional regulator with PAS, ATPase and Fis domain
MIKGEKRKPLIIGSSECIKEVRRRIERFSKSNLPVLITGETGVGKEVTARLIHIGSDRRDKLFLMVNCPELRPELARSELFGHERGAYTGADRRRIGKFERAEGGTIFLDEIADLNPDVQAMVLRAVEKREIERLGGKETIKLNVRVIAASNKDIEKLVEDGYFRKDLYFRLRGHMIHIPPLRDRKEDIPELVDHFISLYSLGEPPILTDEVFDELLRHEWPGNVRELEMLMRSICQVYGEKKVGVNELRGLGFQRITPTRLPPQFNLKDEVERFERDLILMVLEESGWNITQAADRMGMSRVGLMKKLKKFGIKRPMGDE